MERSGERGRTAEDESCTTGHAGVEWRSVRRRSIDMRVALATVLAAVVVEASGDGPTDGLDGLTATVQVMAVRGAAWDKVYSTQSSIIDARVADGVATLLTCDPPARATPIGGGSCDQGAARFDGDGKTLELRWDGERVDERDVTAAP